MNETKKNNKGVKRDKEDKENKWLKKLNGETSLPLYRKKKSV